MSSPDPRPDPAPLLLELFERLRKAGLSFCHWKSNEHLAEGLAGMTDLDLLVAPDAMRGFNAIVLELGFLPAQRSAAERMPGRRDFLRLDPHSGRWLHLDVHEQLILGEQVVKNHHLPLEAIVLAELEVRLGVPVPRPEVELLLLWIRAHLKITPKRLRQRRNRSGVKTLPSAIIREMTYLQSRIDKERFQGVVEASALGLRADEVLESLDRILDARVTTPELGRTRADLLETLRPWRRRGTPGLWLHRQRLARSKRRGKNGRRLGRGCVIALVGADGAGKTTLTATLGNWLGRKLRVRAAYLGIPKTHRLDRTLVALRKHLARRAKEGPRSGSQRAARLVSALRWLFAARYRQHETLRARRHARAGDVVLCDRHPVPEFASMSAPMDGPRIRSEGGPTWLAAWEERIYSDLPPPDGLLVLRARLDVLRGRKDDLAIDLHREKANAVLALTAKPGRHLIDAELPEDEVLLELKRRVWETLLATSALRR